MTAPVLAAGAICWRKTKTSYEILLIHRPNHADYSFPKGKIDPGETIPAAAVRELEEETGYQVSLAAPLGTSEYKIPSGRDKIVYYWAVKLDEKQHKKHVFEPNSEVDALHWVSVEEAKKLLSYKRDKELLAEFDKKLKKDQIDTFPIIILRHAKAQSLSDWPGDDHERPLQKSGENQAKAIVNTAGAWDVKTIITSTAKRCKQTVQPLAKALGVKLKKDLALTQQDGPGIDPSLTPLVKEILAAEDGVILSTHAPVVPRLVSELVMLTESKVTPQLRAGLVLNTAEFLILHVSKADKKIRATERYNTNEKPFNLN